VKSKKEVVELVTLLSELSPGYYPGPIFQQFSRLTVNPIVEVVPLRRRPDDSVEVLLLERDADDPIFSGQLHTPGTVVRPNDSAGSFDDALSRILDYELKGVKTTPATFVKNILHHSGRGMEASQIFWVELLEDPRVGQFYGVDNLPEQLMQSQLEFISLAVEHYLGSNNNLVSR
jgi:hypothetical protein